ncbi:hypothetical protein GOP47_0027160 [Adiantum capillus-veneris]|nr:hypothetical protein GOP47_0027160 [Adiantum capillus-veneris]
MSVDIENFVSEDVEMSISRLRGNDSSDQGGRPTVVSIWQQSSGEAGISVVNESDQRCDLQGNRLQSTSMSVGPRASGEGMSWFSSSVGATSGDCGGESVILPSPPKTTTSSVPSSRSTDASAQAALALTARRAST